MYVCVYILYIYKHCIHTYTLTYYIFYFKFHERTQIDPYKYCVCAQTHVIYCIALCHRAPVLSRNDVK